ncbi:MAG: T9SS type A sorting domain-containing protein, partial [candidate division Zixibacteria bacterium]|nr:T9SS type A sorting domain-containing protein [candidate division Zixibacteria bacterium]
IWPRNLPFNVTYYGESFSTFSICDNGYITMGEAWWANFLNTNIPAPQNAPAMIAPFWDDMAGPLYVRYHHDEENGRFIIGWNNVRSNDTYQYQTFEIIILDTEQWPTTTGDNEIIFQYQMATNPYSASVGICNNVRDDGIQYLFNNDYTPGAANVYNERAIKFTTGSEYMVDIDDQAEAILPNKLSLSQNYPNPFNPTTNIGYQLPADSYVNLEVFDILGRKVRTLVDQTQAAGHWTISWDSRDSDNQPVSAGVYFYKLTTNNEQLIKKMILLK